MAPRYSTTEDEDWCAWLRRLGASMREVRESLGLSQEELASRAGLSQGSVSRFENGRNNHIGALVILKLGAALARQCHGPREPLLVDAMKDVLAEFARLGGPSLAAPALLDGRGAAGDAPSPRTVGHNLFLRERETWTIGHQGAVRPLRDNKGMRYIAHLLRNPGSDVPARTLLEGHGRNGSVAPPSGDAGGVAAERARLSVTRAIRRALFRIAAVQPSLGRHLHAAIRTGARCSYAPDGSSAIAWEVAETD